MLERANGQFTIEGQVEDIFGGTSGVTRIARISQTCHFTGALEGDSIAELTAVLLPNGEQRIQGFQRISGKLGERAGSFVVQVSGNAAKGQPRGEWTIVPKTGTGDFIHIRGTGTFGQSAGKSGNYTLEFDLRKPRKQAERATAVEESTPAEPVASEKPAPRGRTRKNAIAEPAIEVVPASEPIAAKPPRPARARKSPPQEQQPVQLPVEPAKPPRPRRAKAA